MAVRKFIFLQTTGDTYFEEQAATDEISLGKLTAAGVGGIAIDATGDRIVNVPDSPSAGTDAVNKNYVDAAIYGLDWKQSVRLATTAALAANTAAGSGVGKTLTADANGALSVDSVAVVVGNRILVKNEIPASDNGIYVVTATGDGSNPYILTRSVDADQNVEVTANAACFIEEGTVNGDTGWVLTTNDPVVVDSTSLVWAQFSSTVSYTFDAGLSQSGGSVSVELDGTADLQSAGSGGGSSGLEFDIAGAAGKLRARVGATGGINRGADGLIIELDPTATTAGSNPTDATSATGLTTLRSPRTEENRVADSAVAVGDPVCNSTVTSGRVLKSEAGTDILARVIGVARTASTGAGDTIAVTLIGEAAGTLTGASLGVPYYLGATGGMTATAPGSGNRIIRIGYSRSSTSLSVEIADLGKKIA